MRVLAVDTQSKVMAVVIVTDEGAVGEVLDAGVTHSQTLMPTIDKVLKDNGLTIDDIDTYAVDVGPGSFTGIRIGVNTINALAYATSKRVIEFDAFDANELKSTGVRAIDCKHGNYYVKRDGVLSVESGESLEGEEVLYLDPNRLSVQSIADAVRSNVSATIEQAVPKYVRESEAERNICV